MSRCAQADAFLRDQEESWPPEDVEEAQGWRIRASDGGHASAGYRLNSALPPCGLDPTLAGLDAVERSYAARGATPAIQLAMAIGDPASDAVADALKARSYAPIHETTMLDAPIEMARASLAGRAAAGRNAPRVLETRTPLAALEVFWRSGGVGPARLAAMRRADARRSITLIARYGDRLAGAVFIAVGGARAFAHALYVDEAARGNGVGAALIAAGASFGVQRGATLFAASALADNAAAQALFHKAGCVERGAYRYFVRSNEE